MTRSLHGSIVKKTEGVPRMAEKKTYDKEYKIQAVKLGREIGISKAARELGIVGK